VEARDRDRGAKTSEGKRQERIGPRTSGNTGPRRTDSPDAPKPLKPPVGHAERLRSCASRTQGQEGQGRSKDPTGYRRGEDSEGGKPMSVTGMKKGRKGCGRSKASRGRESLKAQRSRVRQARHESLPASSSAEGHQNPMEGPSGKAKDERESVKENAGTDKSSRVKLWTRGQRQERRLRCASGGLGRRLRRPRGATPESPGAKLEVVAPTNTVTRIVA